MPVDRARLRDRRLERQRARVWHLPDSCRLIVEQEDRGRFPCKLSGGPGSVDGAPYKIQLSWDSPAVAEATAIVDAIPGRPQLTMQLVGPIDSTEGVWQEWQATSGPGFGRVDVGL